MTEILYFNKPTSQESVEQMCGIKRSELYNPACTSSRMLVPNTPYLIGKRPNVRDRQILNLLKPLSVSREIGSHITHFGGDNTLALSKICQGLRDYDFSKIIQRYQNALLEYRDASRHGKGDKKLVQLKVTRDFNAMQKGFQDEMTIITRRINDRRHARQLSNARRRMNIVGNSRRIARLDLGYTQAENLVKYTQYAKVLGRGEKKNDSSIFSGDGVDDSDLKFTFGLQGGGKIGVSRIFAAEFDLDFGSREASFATGSESVNQSFVLAVEVAGFGLGFNASRNVPISGFTRGKDSIIGILSGVPFVFKPVFSTPFTSSVTAGEFLKFEFGASALLGVEGTLDFSDGIK